MSSLEYVSLSIREVELYSIFEIFFHRTNKINCCPLNNKTFEIHFDTMKKMTKKRNSVVFSVALPTEHDDLSRIIERCVIACIDEKHSLIV